MEKYKELFKTQSINLVNDLILVFPNDMFLEKAKQDLIIYLKDENFVFKLREYFTEDIESSIMNKNSDYLLGGYILPISKENIIKLKLQKYWSCLSDKNKEKVWAYLNILLKIYSNM